MALIPIEHSHRLMSAAEAEAFYRELGEERISVRGFHTRNRGRIARLIDAIEPERQHTISFEEGTLSKAACGALDRLALSPFQYLDVRAHAESLRIWPELYTWVHTSRSLASLGEGLVVGENTLFDGKVTIETRGDLYTLETKSIPLALRLFHQHPPDETSRGFINGVKPEAKEPLLDFLEALEARVDATLFIEGASARSLTELYAGEPLDWQAGGVLVDFPEGKVHGFLTSSAMSEADRDEWQSRVTEALRRADLV